MPTRRPTAVAGALLVLAGAVVPLVGAPSGAGAAPTLTVSPDTGLADRQVVEVSGDGLVPARTVVVTQCAPTVGACRLDVLTARTGRTGTFARTVRVRRLISRADAPAVDCAATACRIVVTYQGDPTTVLSAGITFDPAAPFSAAPAASITPDTALPPLTTVTLHATGFARSTVVAVAECVHDTPADRCIGLSLETTDASGGLDVSIRVSRLPFSTDTDCLAVGCVLRVLDASRGDVAGVRLAFDPTIPVPTVTIDPTGPLPYRTSVVATLRHFTPGHAYTVAECYGQGGCDPAATGTADAGGELRLRVAVRRVVDGISEDGPYPIDCAVSAICRIEVEPGTGTDLERRSVWLTFDPTTMPRVRVGSVTVRETDGPQYALVPVTLDAQAATPVSVHFTTHEFTARAGTDYVAAPGTLVIPPGRTRATIAIVVVGDGRHERPETALVVIDQPVNATIADGDAVLTIHDDD